MPSAPAPLYVSTPRRGALSSVYLSANNRNNLLIDRSRIPCLVCPTVQTYAIFGRPDLRSSVVRLPLNAA
jgi:hypothetical protein